MAGLAYQTYELPNGSIIKGFSPTLLRFAEIKKRINFEGRSVLDLGCNIGSFAMQAALSGASEVCGIDNNSAAIVKGNQIVDSFPLRQVNLFCDDLYTFFPSKLYDIVIISLVLHWMDEAEDAIKRFFSFTQKDLVVIYRYPTPTLGEQGYRPTVEALSNTLETNPSSVTSLENCGPNHVVMVIYEKAI